AAGQIRPSLPGEAVQPAASRQRAGSQPAAASSSPKPIPDVAPLGATPPPDVHDGPAYKRRRLEVFLSQVAGYETTLFSAVESPRTAAVASCSRPMGTESLDISDHRLV